jgi:hypothetical protein
VGTAMGDYLSLHRLNASLILAKHSLIVLATLYLK